jgi:2-dehydropantoate 2-reductase
MRGKKSEIDYLNGEIAALGERSGRPAPLNLKAVELVHEVERSRRFYSPEQVIEQFNQRR